MLEGKIPAHEALRVHARVIIDTPLAEMSLKDRERLGHELILQVAARRDDLIPDDVRTTVICEVVKAAALMYNSLSQHIINLAISNIGLEELQRMLAEFDEQWVMYRCGNLECEVVHVATRAYFEQEVADAQRVYAAIGRMSMITMMVESALGTSLVVPDPQLFWPLPEPEEQPGGESGASEELSGEGGEASTEAVTGGDEAGD